MKFVSEMTDQLRLEMLDPANEAELKRGIKSEWLLRFAIWMTQKRLGVPFGRAFLIVLAEIERKAKKI